MNESVILNAIEGLSARIDNLNARIDDLSARIDNLNVRVDDLSARIDNLNVRVDDLSARIDDLNEKVDNMDKKFTEKIDFIDAKFTRKCDALDTRLSFVERMQNALKEGQEEGFARLQGEIKALDKRFTKFEEQNEREHEEFRNAIGIS